LDSPMFSRALSEEDPIKKIDLILEILQKPLPLAKDDICLRALVLHDLWMNLFLPWLDDAKCMISFVFLHCQNSD
jgi:hypothetical protein